MNKGTSKKIMLLFVWFLYTSFTANAQWTQTKGPSGGYVFCLAVKDSNILSGTSGGLRIN